MAQKFQPPANLRDFDRSQRRDELYRLWHARMNGWVSQLLPSYPAAFSGIAVPQGVQVSPANPQWTGLPRTIKRLVGTSLADAGRLVDEPRAIGDYDPVDRRAYEKFKRLDGSDFEGPAYRSQDEYLEWSIKRDPDGVISEILFTCEGPEYWEQIAEGDPDLLVTLYREICGDQTITLDDLVFPEDVTWKNPYSSSPRPDEYRAGSYNPFNAANMRAAVHLTQPANTLGAELKLAFDATYPYGNPNLVTADPDLACCAAYGGINRMSDPTIGAGVNAQVVQLRRKVALRNPIGLYIQGMRPNAFTLEDGSRFEAQGDSWKVLRPDPADLTDMIVRARFRIPDGVTYQGRQLRLGDLFMQNERVTTGGQVADAITMVIYAIAVPGAPQQVAQRCVYRPCFSNTHPDFIVPVLFGRPCPQQGAGGGGDLEFLSLESAKLRTELAPATLQSEEVVVPHTRILIEP